MLAVDTNVLIRFLVGDDRRQEERAANLIRTQPIWVSKTVLLETYWVLGSSYGYTPAARAEALRELASIRNVSFEDEQAVVRAIAWTDRGLEFADALHLASVSNPGRFATFDRKLARRAKLVTDLDVLSA